MITDAEIIKKVQDFIGRNDYEYRGPKDGLEEKTVEFMDILDKFDGQVQGSILEAFREKTRLDQPGGGEFISNPVGVVDGTGEAFGYDERQRGGTKIEVNLALDCSASMACADGVEYESSSDSYVATDLGKSNPLFLAPRLFFASLVMRYLYNGFNAGVAAVGAESSMKISAYCFAVGHRGQFLNNYNGEVWMRHNDYGGATPILPLWKKFYLRENIDGDANANRLDLIITDGAFNHTDMSVINGIQYDRFASGGTLTTVIVNIAPESLSSWSSKNSVPEYGVIYYTNSPAQLAMVFQQALLDIFTAT